MNSSVLTGIEKKWVSSTEVTYQGEQRTNNYFVQDWVITKIVAEGLVGAM